MTKVITYGTYDLLHYGHRRLLERAKALGDYLIVGVTADDFDKIRGKINVQQSLMERVEAVRELGIADEIIIEEYEGQKIDDIKRYDIDIFTVGSDWVGKFDYLNEYCRVVYLERTEGVSSSEIREEKRTLLLGLVGDSQFLNKVASECNCVNGIKLTAICTSKADIIECGFKENILITDNYSTMLNLVDAVYIKSLPEYHYKQIKEAIKKGKHVLCESPVTLKKQQTKRLFEFAKNRNVILMEAIKTAYATAFLRLLLLIKSGKIGEIISIDATCTSLRQYDGKERTDWSGMYEWGPTALLPILQVLGTKYVDYRLISHFTDDEQKYDGFTKIDFVYDHAVASAKVGDNIKSEGELIISGTHGYIYVPAPWWKTDYFEIRYENPTDNKRYFYNLEGEGIRYELVAFIRSIEKEKLVQSIDVDITYEISNIMDDFSNKNNMIII